jgi:hypothetical protein
MAVLGSWGHNKSHLGLLQDPVLYLQCKGAAFTIPAAAPLAYPVIMASATTAKCKEHHAKNISARKAWSTYMIVHTITCDQFAASCLRPIGVPGVKRDKEEINIVCF